MQLRWQLRFDNFKKALAQLENGLALETPSDLEKEGIIQRFEYTYELAWKTLQDLLESKGYSDIRGPRPVIEQAFSDGYLEDGEGWMAMLKHRNDTVHTYNQSRADDVYTHIRTAYCDLFRRLQARLNAL
ncbi:MAG: nucleotidyltransferase substrate binding protein [Candidatus Margulisiibacteriota bacterium]